MVSLQDLKLHKRWNLVLVCGAAQEADKEDFLVELGNICSDQRLPLLIGGDFNILRFTSEKKQGDEEKQMVKFVQCYYQHL
jgi:hypothetical protein